MRMTRLMNSAMMPVPGQYRLTAITRDQFVRELRSAHGNGGLVSYIGYEQNVRIISKLSGIQIPVNRAETTLAPGDVMLIMRLKYRVTPANKGQEVSENDFEYFKATYK